MQVASMGATTLSYKDFDPAFVAAETEARIAVIEKDNIELGRRFPQYISMGKTLKATFLKIHFNGLLDN